MQGQARQSAGGLGAQQEQGHTGASPVGFVACVGGNWSEVDNPCVGLRKRNAPVRTTDRATGARLRREGEVGHGNPACRGVGCPASLGDAGDLWGQVGWMMVAPGEAHGGLWPRALPLGTYNTKRKKKSPGLEKATGERQAFCHWQTACLGKKGRDFSNWLPEWLCRGELSRFNRWF